MVSATVALILLGIACLLGLLLTALQMPGIWLIVAAAAGYGWHEQFRQFTPAFVGLLAGLAVAAELCDFLPSLMLARRAGASSRAAWFGLIGGIVGMFALSLPLPIIGTVAGGVIGCFAGAVIGELSLHDNVDRAARVGFAAAVGRVVGLVAKLSVAVVMVGLCGYAAFAG